MDSDQPVVVDGHPLPHTLAQHRREDLATVAAGRASPGDLAEARASLAWMSRLPAVVDDVRRRWELVLDSPFEPGGSTAWVAGARDAAGRDLVLKVAWAHDDSRDEAQGLAAWQGHGAVHLARHETVGDTSTLLMERVRPGELLAAMLPDRDTDVVVSAMVRTLRTVQVPDPADLSSWAGPATMPRRFRPLARMCTEWADGSAARLALDDQGLPSDIIEHGLALFRELPHTWDGDAALLATDLHPENVLARRERPGTELGDWVLIDPKPYVGDPHYDVLQHMLNFPDRLVADPIGFADRMAGLADLDRYRTRTWLFARCVQESGVMDSAPAAALALARVL